MAMAVRCCFDTVDSVLETGQIIKSRKAVFQDTAMFPQIKCHPVSLHSCQVLLWARCWVCVVVVVTKQHDPGGTLSAPNFKVARTLYFIIRL